MSIKDQWGSMRQRSGEQSELFSFLCFRLFSTVHLSATWKSISVQHIGESFNYNRESGGVNRDKADWRYKRISLYSLYFHPVIQIKHKSSVLMTILMFHHSLKKCSPSLPFMPEFWTKSLWWEKKTFVPIQSNPVKDIMYNLLHVCTFL